MNRLIYDGDCDFCQACVNWLKVRTKDNVEFVTYQKIQNNYPQIKTEEFEKAVKYDNGVQICSGAEAIYKALTFSKFYRFLYWMYQHIPGFACLSEFGYRYVATHRYLFSRFIK